MRGHATRLAKIQRRIIGQLMPAHNMGMRKTCRWLPYLGLKCDGSSIVFHPGHSVTQNASFVLHNAQVQDNTWSITFQSEIRQSPASLAHPHIVRRHQLADNAPLYLCKPCCMTCASSINARCAEIRSQASYLPNSKANNWWSKSRNSKIAIIYCIAFWEVTCLRALMEWSFKRCPWNIFQ